MPDQSSAATEHAILQEITRPLEALPDDPLSVVNAEFPTTLRGYDRVAVDEYVRRTRQLVAELQATRSPEAAVRRALERVGEEITGILQRAHETAEQITAQSRSEAEDRLEEARQEAAHVAQAAEQRVHELDADTDRIWLERQRIVGDAEELAAQLLGLAKTAAERFPADGGVESPSAEVSRPADESAGQDASPVAEEDNENEYYDEAPYREAEPDEADDVTRTVAFEPLTPPEFPAAPGDRASEAPGHATAEPSAAEPPPESSAAEPPPEPSAAEPPEPSAAGPPPDSGENLPADRSSASEDPTAERDPGPQDAGPDRHSTSDDTTAVIPPASQAASRRLSQ
ncbi:MAG TPA: DivIVA domain-containing protein [Solirubrobacteraceae bacterium]|nr:DivIVA domain-containing protein [Solirubrobacteraceae bacterium]